MPKLTTSVVRKANQFRFKPFIERAARQMHTIDVQAVLMFGNAFADMDEAAGDQCILVTPDIVWC